MLYSLQLVCIVCPGVTFTEAKNDGSDTYSLTNGMKDTSRSKLVRCISVGAHGFKI